MLGKLVKDEFKSYRFSFGIVFLTGVIFTVFMKAICMIPYQGEAKAVIQAFVIIGYIFILALMSVAAQVLVVIRFYSTMVGDRGYLTWTLPATSATHIWSKLIGGTLWKILAGIVMIVLLVLFFAGNYWMWFDEFQESFSGGYDQITMGMILREMFQSIMEDIDMSDIIYMILQMIAGFIWSAAALLLVYMCIAIGQLFGKWRILASIGCYFVIVIVIQIISTIVVAVLSLQTVKESQYYAAGTAWDIISIIISMIVGIMACAGLFAVTNYIFKKHLNLE